MHKKPKKSLGQSFLVDKNIQKKIIRACQFKNSDIVLEIGAGRGELTGLIAEETKTLYALEIDPCLCESLKEGLKNYRNIKVINQDILKFNFQKYFNKYENKIKVVGNIPYYISSPIIELLLKAGANIATVFIMVQKEFAKRMVAAPGSKDYGSFSCFVQYYSSAQILFFVKNNSFFPRPAVDSSFIRLDIIDNPPIKTGIKNEKLLFKIIRAAFNKRRKILRNSLDGVIPQKKLEAFFVSRKISSSIRPENLALQDFVNLANT